MNAIKVLGLKKAFGKIILVIAIISIVVGFIGCKKNIASTKKKNAASTKKMPQQTIRKSVEKPVAPEKNPIGDIPDNQAFVKYTSSQGGYELVVPEGWARTTNGMNVTFIDKLDGVSVTVTSSPEAPSADIIRTNQAEKLKKTGRAVIIKSIKDVRLASGPAVLMVYESNSEPEPVTNKQVRLDNNTYSYYKSGKLAELRLWAPVGADNVDQWNRISNSFKVFENVDKKQMAIETYNPKINPADFTVKVNNPYFSLTPGMTFIYKSKTDKGLEINKVTVTNKTKRVMGVTTLVVWDRVWLNNVLKEETYDWYAQDKAGNVWYLGEDSKEYANGKVVSAKGSWEAGVDGAMPGIIMKAKPQVDDFYHQEYYKNEAEDMAKVLSLNEAVVVPYGTFKNCLKTKDWSAIEPNVIEYKYYSPTIGNVVLETGANTKVVLIDIKKNNKPNGNRK